MVDHITYAIHVNLSSNNLCIVFITVVMLFVEYSQWQLL